MLKYLICHIASSYCADTRQMAPQGLKTVFWYSENWAYKAQTVRAPLIAFNLIGCQCNQKVKFVEKKIENQLLRNYKGIKLTLCRIIHNITIIIIISILEPCFSLPRVGLFDKSFSKVSSPLRTILRVSRIHT